MAFTDWKTLPKIDAHIHILPDAVHAANPDAGEVWSRADIHLYQGIMEANRIEKAVVMPFNDPYMMSMEFTIDAVHKNLGRLKRQCPGRIYAFADIDVRNTSAKTVDAIRAAVAEYGLDGVKIHPNNSGMAVDSDYNRSVFAFAQERGLPVEIHSYPNGEDDVSAAERIAKVAAEYPDLKLIVSHMGAYQWERLLPVRCHVDLSAILPDYVRTFGIAGTNGILRRFGAKRLLFATDYPDSRFLQPDEIYGAYFDILNQMDFTEEEARQIAYGNAEGILGGRG